MTPSVSRAPRYDSIGAGYIARRRQDPRIAAAVSSALGGVDSVVNIGAGAGAYESSVGTVVPVEPSPVMLQQRPAHRAAGVLGRAEELPLADRSVDAALAILTLHHWSDQHAGLAELVRVARERVVLLTLDPAVSSDMWLMADYVPEIAELDRATFPAPDGIAATLGGRVEVVPVPADCTDGFLLAFWAHPEWVLDPQARAATSGFARMPDEVVARAATDVRRDLADGTWQRRYGHLRTRDSYDAGLRLVVAELT